MLFSFIQFSHKKDSVHEMKIQARTIYIPEPQKIQAKKKKEKGA
jgi:hypothetical protein